MSVVEAERFVLRDSHGTARAVLGANAIGSPFLSICDAEGRSRIGLHVDSDGGAWFEFLDEGGTARLTLSMVHGNTRILFDDPHSTALLHGSFNIGEGSGNRVGPGLSLNGENGAIRLTHDSEGRPHVVLHDAAHFPRIHLAVESNGQPRIFAHALGAPSWNSWTGSYNRPLSDPDWLPFRIASHVRKRVSVIEARWSQALAELGETAEAVRANLTRLGILPPADFVWGGGALIARYLCWTKKLAKDCYVHGNAVVCGKRFWFFWGVAVVVEFPPAVREFIAQWNESSRINASGDDSETM